MRLAILTSGGDAPGMNAAIRAATLLARAHGVDVVGIERGYRGLVEGRLRPLEAGDVARVLREGGTMLGSARLPEFARPEVREQARAHLRNAGVEGVIVVGGNGSLTGARALGDADECGDAGLIRVIGIPASIDNDIGLTGLAIGVDTAMNTIVEACDKISDTASAHNRTFIVEVMGRDCGYLAMTAAVAAGADAVLFPEAGKTADEIVDHLVRTVKRVRSRPDRSGRVIVIKAEGVKIAVDELKHRIDDRLKAELPEDPMAVETRVTVLGHVVRGGRPSAFDRLLGSRLAHVAVRAILSGQTQKMASWMPPGDLPEEVAVRTEADPYCWLVDLDAVLADTDEMLAGTSPLVRWRAQVFREIEDVLAL